MRDLIVDLDGTIVGCGRFYRAAKEDIAAGIAQLYDIDVGLAHELIHFLDVWAIRIRPEGFRKERFPRSLACAVAVAQLSTHPERWMYPPVMNWAYTRGHEVFDFEKSPYPLFEGAVETLRAYKDGGWRVWICTKGDPEVQESKLRLHGIDKIVDGWQVVPRKDALTLAQFCDGFGISPRNAVYVGDSVRDDMVPARELGMTAVRVRLAPEDEWTHDTMEDVASNFVIGSVKDLPTVVQI